MTQKMHRPEGTLERGEYLSRAHQYAKRGMDLPHTKLPPGAIHSIREAALDRQLLRQYINDKLSNAALARQWGVHERTIENVLSGETHWSVK